MNKYNALNANYDQLYPQPMKHASTHAKNGSDPITPSMIGTYNKTEIDTALQNKASAYEHQPEIEITSDYFNKPISVQKDDAGNVHISLWNASILKTIPQYGWIVTCNIPTGYRPSHATIATSCVFTNTTLYASAMIMVDDGGNLQVYSGGDRGVAVPNDSLVNFSCSYGT